MKKSSLLLFALAVGLLSSTSAFADTLFNFTFGNAPAAQNKFTGSGQFTAVQQADPNQFLITGITGSIVEGSNVGNQNTEAITGLLASGIFGGNDNLLTLNSNKSFDNNGVAFILADGSMVRLYNNNNQQFLESVANGHSSFSQGSDITISLAGDAATTTATAPEPGSLALLGTGALGVFGVLRRKFAL